MTKFSLDLYGLVITNKEAAIRKINGYLGERRIKTLEKVQTNISNNELFVLLLVAAMMDYQKTDVINILWLSIFSSKAFPESRIMPTIYALSNQGYLKLLEQTGKIRLNLV